MCKVINAHTHTHRRKGGHPYAHTWRLNDMNDITDITPYQMVRFNDCEIWYVEKGYFYPISHCFFSVWFQKAIVEYRDGSPAHHWIKKYGCLLILFSGLHIRLYDYPMFSVYLHMVCSSINQLLIKTKCDRNDFILYSVSLNADIKLDPRGTASQWGYLPPDDTWNRSVRVTKGFHVTHNPNKCPFQQKLFICKSN